MMRRILTTAKFAAPQPQVRFIHTTPVFLQQQQQQTGATTNKRAAVILSGCGFLDGTDVIEAATLNIHLSRLGFTTQFFAPTEEIETSYNYVTREPDSSEERYPHKEAARIVRQKVNNVGELVNQVSEFDVLFVPGGAGALRNLSNFELEKYNLEYSSVNKSVQQSIQSFFKSEKPIGASAQGAFVVAAVLGTENGGPGINVTMGRADREQFDVIAKLGSKASDLSGTVVDDAVKIVSSGASASNPNVDPYDLYRSMIELVNETVKLIKK